MPRLQIKLLDKENIAISNYNTWKCLSLLIFLRAAILDFMMSLRCLIVSNERTSAFQQQKQRGDVMRSKMARVSYSC